MVDVTVGKDEKIGLNYITQRLSFLTDPENNPGKEAKRRLQFNLDLPFDDKIEPVIAANKNKVGILYGGVSRETNPIVALKDRVKPFDLFGSQAFLPGKQVITQEQIDTMLEALGVDKDSVLYELVMGELDGLGVEEHVEELSNLIESFKQGVKETVTTPEQREAWLETVEEITEITDSVVEDIQENLPAFPDYYETCL